MNRTITRPAVALAAALLAATAGGVPARAAAPGAITCHYVFFPYSGGFSATVVVANTGPAVNGWTLTWSFPADTSITGVWQSRITQPAPRTAVAVNAPWNAAIPSGQSINFGWTANAPFTDVPTDLALNGTPC